MQSIARPFVLLFALLLVAGCAERTPSPTAQQELVDRSRITFDKLMGHPDFTELTEYVRRSKAVLIFPSLIKGAFGVGGEGGSGVLVARAPGGWSDPAFYRVSAGSLGLQVGGQVSEVIITVMSDKGLDALINNQFEIGGDMEGAAGPIGKSQGVSTTTNFGADVYSFAMSSGLFGGLSLEGSAVLKRDDYNQGYYGQGATPYAILIERRFTNPNTSALKASLAPY
ncbi:MAG TPA: lipid-binding SYLF domain-containing protein [Dongiaceae bacterium]